MVSNSLAGNTTKRSLLPPPSNPCRLLRFHILLISSSSDARALVRLQSDHVNRTLVPAYYRYLQAQEESVQIKNAKEFHAALEKLVNLLERAEGEVLGGGGVSGEGERKSLTAGLGLWVEGGELGLTDVMVGPCEFIFPFFFSQV